MKDILNDFIETESPDRLIVYMYLEFLSEQEMINFNYPTTEGMVIKCLDSNRVYYAADRFIYHYPELENPKILVEIEDCVRTHGNRGVVIDFKSV